MESISKTENFDFDRKSMLKRLDEYEKRWINLFKSLNTEIIEPSAFEYLELELDGETSKLKLDITVAGASGYLKSRAEYLTFMNKVDNSRAKIDSYAAKARALTISRWKDKNRDILQKILEFFTELVKKVPKMHGG